jgi:hypothetical protein
MNQEQLNALREIKFSISPDQKTDEDPAKKKRETVSEPVSVLEHLKDIKTDEDLGIFYKLFKIFLAKEFKLLHTDKNPTATNSDFQKFNDKIKIILNFLKTYGESHVTESTSDFKFISEEKRADFIKTVESATLTTDQQTPQAFDDDFYKTEKSSTSKSGHSFSKEDYPVSEMEQRCREYFNIKTKLLAGGLMMQFDLHNYQSFEIDTRFSKKDISMEKDPAFFAVINDDGTVAVINKDGSSDIKCELIGSRIIETLHRDIDLDDKGRFDPQRLTNDRLQISADNPKIPGEFIGKEPAIIAIISKEEMSEKLKTSQNQPITLASRKGSYNDSLRLQNLKNGGIPKQEVREKDDSTLSAVGPFSQKILNERAERVAESALTQSR